MIPQPPPRPHDTEADGARTPRALPCDQLSGLLRTGPFSEALRMAIRGRGLSLSRLQDRLSQHGAPVTAATISAWQSGKCRPERPHALMALAALESILGLPATALSSLLAPPKPRGRWVNAAAARPSLAEAWSGLLHDTLDAVETRWTAHLTCVSRHHRVDIDAQGREAALWSRQVLRAETDGPDRYIVSYQSDQPGPAPVLRPSSPERVGAVSQDPAHGTLVAELLFDRPLARGETVIVEYLLEHAVTRPTAHQAGLYLQVPVRECVIEVRFDPAAPPPTSCYAFHIPHASPAEARERVLRLDASLRTHTVGLDLAPSRFGIRWSWDGS
ncbi:transcriptional regulator [Streptomyces sp. NPDC057197]|uniref:transcriptional regulator n=1 Tax=unclassified Streptomyces TaxID=2593676 RepID=UPI003644F921